MRTPRFRGTVPVVRTVRQTKCRTCFIKKDMHSTLLRLSVSSISVTSDTVPRRVRHVFPVAFSMNVRRKAIVILRRQRACRVAAFQARSGCRGFHEPRGIRCIHDLRSSLGEHSFAVGTVTVSQRKGVGSFFDKRRSLTGGLVETINGPRRHFERSTLHVVHTTEFIDRLSFRVRRTAGRTVIRCRPLLSGVTIRHIHRR